MTILSTILTNLAAALTSLGMLLGLVHASAPVASVNYVPIATTSAASLIPSGALGNSSVTKGVFTDKNWAITFTLRPEWNVNEILDATDKLHQMIISGSQQVLFISKDEAIGLSGDLTSTTATRTVAGQNVEVRTYTKPDSTYAYYQTFSLKEGNDTYNFLLKSATSDTTVTDTFIRSIAVK